MTEVRLSELLREAGEEELREIPARHPLKTDDCPSLVRFAAVAGGDRWAEDERGHVGGCEYCQRVTARGYHARCPSLGQIVAFLAERNPDRRAVEIHVEKEACPRCTRLLASPLLRGAAALLRAGGSAWEEEATGTERV